MIRAPSLFFHYYQYNQCLVPILKFPDERSVRLRYDNAIFLVEIDTRACIRTTCAYDYQANHRLRINTKIEILLRTALLSISSTCIHSVHILSIIVGKSIFNFMCTRYLSVSLVGMYSYFQPSASPAHTYSVGT